MLVEIEEWANGDSQDIGKFLYWKWSSVEWDPGVKVVLASIGGEELCFRFLSGYLQISFICPGDHLLCDVRGRLRQSWLP